MKDLQALALQLANNDKMWTSLAPQERQAVADIFKNLGLDLGQVRYQAKQEFIDARMKDLLIKWEVSGVQPYHIISLEVIVDYILT